MGYPFEDLSAGQFEAFVVQAARLKLGKGVQGFADGVDGGRDARFEGRTGRSLLRVLDALEPLLGRAVPHYGLGERLSFGRAAWCGGP